MLLSSLAKALPQSLKKKNNKMKYLSIVLKVVAVLAAAFCVFAWLDKNGTIKKSLSYMDGLTGADIVAKSQTIPGILKEKKTFQDDFNKEKAKSDNLEIKLREVNGDLDTERSKGIQLNSELQKKNTELRTTNTALETSKKKVVEQTTLIEGLKQEIVSTKNMISQNNEATELKSKLASLESTLAAKEGELAAALAKIKTYESSEIVEVVETDAATGKQIKRKVIKTPYVPSGEIAAVLKVDLKKNNLIAINKGSKDKLEVGQKLLLKRQISTEAAQNIAEVTIDEVSEDFSICLVDMKYGIPETIEVGDLLELAPAPVAAAPAPAAAPEGTPAPAAAPAAEVAAPAAM